MNRRYVVAVAFLGIAACTTSGPESPVPGAKAETSVITSNPTAAEGVIEQVGVPEAPKDTIIAVENSLDCRKEKLTGSHIPQVVCMTHSERDRLRKVAQDNMEALRRKPSAVPEKQ